MSSPTAPSWRGFLRLWFILTFAYSVLRCLFNLIVMGWIDIRPVVLGELLVLPLGQTIVLWTITRGRRRDRAAPPGQPS